MGSEWNVQQYLESIEYPASREDLISDAQNKDAPQDFIQDLEGLAERGSEFNNPSEVLEAMGYEDQERE